MLLTFGYTWNIRTWVSGINVTWQYHPTGHNLDHLDYRILPLESEGGVTIDMPSLTWCQALLDCEGSQNWRTRSAHLHWWCMIVNDSECMCMQFRVATSCCDIALWTCEKLKLKLMVNQGWSCWVHGNGCWSLANPDVTGLYSTKTFRGATACCCLCCVGSKVNGSQWCCHK